MKAGRVLVFLSVFLLGAGIVHCEEDAGEPQEPEDSQDPEVEAEEAYPSGVGVVAEDNGVLILTKENFDEVIKDVPTILVEFYAPWCGHCKTLAPEYEQAAMTLRQDDSPVVLAKVDATVHSELASRFDVSGYPTLKYFIKGTPHDYDGPRQSDGIVQYMRERADPDYKPPPPAAIVLTDANFVEITQQEPLMLVEFFAPWCGHCKQLAPVYEKAASILAASDPPIKLATVDATENSNLATKYGVSGYPTLKVFRYGKAYDYNGGRDEQGIVSYMEGQRGEGTKEVKSLKELQKALSEVDVTVVGFFKDKESKLYETYAEVANVKREDFEFLHTFDSAAAKKYSVKEEGIVVVGASRFQTEYEPTFHTLDEASPTAADITEFLESKQNPLVGAYTSSSAGRRYKSTRPVVLMFFAVDFTWDHREATQMWRLKLAKIAKDFPGLTFAIADEEENDQLFKKFGFDESSEELNIGVLGEKDMRYPMPPNDEFDAEEIKDFLKQFKAGDLKPRLSSQPVPKKKKGPVTVVVGKTFEKIVQDAKKDVLIELYAPWCGHCKTLAPIYKDVAKHFKSDKNIVIAKMDATANDAPAQFAHAGFPTIYLAPAGRAAVPIKYEGPNEKDELVKFVKEHATSLRNAKDEL